MFLDLTDVLRGPGERIEKSFEIAQGRLDDIELAAPVEGVVRVDNARKNIVVGGRAHTAIAVPCARCLEPTNQELELEFEAVAPVAFFRAAGFGAPQAAPAVRAHEAALEDEVEGEPDDEMAALFEGHSLDVLELVRQAIELKAPIQPLCSADCKGLPGTEQYFVAPDDGRWNALKEWQNGHPKEVSENGDSLETEEPKEG